MTKPKLSGPYSPEVYASLRKAIKTLLISTHAFVLGLETEDPEVWNWLACLAFDFGPDAVHYAARACLAITPKRITDKVKHRGYAVLAAQGEINNHCPECGCQVWYDIADGFVVAACSSCGHRKQLRKYERVINAPE